VPECSPRFDIIAVLTVEIERMFTWKRSRTSRKLTNTPNLLVAAGGSLMSDTAVHLLATEKLDHSAENDPQLATTVLQELDRVLASRLFKNSPRSRQFLEYIVRRKLEGHAEELKERTIGIELFQRPANYATGDDPVVRVQAGEVRRRLEQYYQAETQLSPVRIELRVGSYAPHFRMPTSEPSRLPELPRKAPDLVVRKATTTRSGIVLLSLAVVCLLFLGVVAYSWRNLRPKTQPPSLTQQFWAPALASEQPVLICLAKPVVYRPSLALYRNYSSVHPGSFPTEVERSNSVLPLAPNTKLVWSDMIPYSDYGVALGDVEAAVAVSAMMGKLAKATQVRIGDHYSFEDLHNSPSVVIGAFNNKWTMRITAGFHFEFFEKNGDYTIREQIANGREWHSRYDQSLQNGQDFAVVARLLDSSTGQFTVIAAGISGSGTQAASDLISDADLLEKALRTLPAGWQKKNIQLVLRTNVTDGVAGPSHVEAFYVW
jgi:hypothetical protein